MHWKQQWYDISDGAIGGHPYENASMRLFARLSLDLAISDCTTITYSRHLLEQHQIACQLFDVANQWLCEASIR